MKILKKMHKKKPESTGRKICKRCCKLTGKLFGFAFLAFAGTFLIYIFNLENKLLYYVVRPFLNKHYDSQVRDRRI